MTTRRLHSLPDLPTELVDGRYEVLGSLGSGAQGAVLRVRDRSTGDELVLKAVVVAESALAARAVIAEFGHLARIEDPGLPRVRDLAVAETVPFASGRG